MKLFHVEQLMWLDTKEWLRRTRRNDMEMNWNNFIWFMVGWAVAAMFYWMV